MGRIAITSPRAVQLVALAAAAMLLLNAYFLATVGRDYPPFRCAPPWEPAFAAVLAGARGGVAVGLIVAALQSPARGLQIRDPLLVGMLMALGASVALASGLRALATGFIYLGRRGCIDVGPPVSYPIGAVIAVFGGALLIGAVLVLLRGMSGGSVKDS